MTIFLILILIVSQIVAYFVICFIVSENRKTMIEITDKITNTYLSKIEKEFEARAPSGDDIIDPDEIEELSEEELSLFRNKIPNKTGDI